MSCGLGLSFFPKQYKSPTGLERAGCPIRLKELNNASKVSPTKLKGAQVSRENYIRRRVATIKQVKSCLPKDMQLKNNTCNNHYAYGPVFGTAKGPKYGGKGCINVYYANGGSGSDVTKWKRLYGGPRVLFSTSNCAYGCCGKVGKNGLTKGCISLKVKKNNTFVTTFVTTVVGGIKVGDMIWDGTNLNNTPPIDPYDAVVHRVDAGQTHYYIKCKNKNSYMSKIIGGVTTAPVNTPLDVYRKGPLNNWKLVGKINKYQVEAVIPY